VPVVDLSEQREVIGGILLQKIVLDYDHLQLLHVKLGVHLNRALVDEVNY
jgi:hypothetical protein